MKTQASIELFDLEFITEIGTYGSGHIKPGVCTMGRRHVLHVAGTGQSTHQGPNGGEPPVHRNDLTRQPSGTVSQ